MKRILLFLAMAVVIGSVVFAGGNRASTTAASSGTSVVRWSYWGGEARIKNNQLAIDAFTENTGIIVASEPAPGTGEHFNKFAVQFAGGNAADIIQLGGDFSNLGVGDDVGSVLLPLTQFVQSGVLDISKVDASAIASGTVNGTLYALPLAANMPGILYNRSLLERVGAPIPKVSMTWAEFNQWLSDVQAKLPSGTYAFADNSATISGSYFFGYWCRQNGTSMWDGTKTNLTSAIVQQYLDLWSGYRTSGFIPPADVAASYAETNESTSSLIAGRVVACAIWSNQLINYQTAIGDTLDLIEFPNAVATNALWGQMSQMMGINKDSKNAAAAAQFISYRVNDVSVWRIMGADPGTPVTPDARAVVSTTDQAKRIDAYLDVAGQHASARDPNMPSDTEWNAGFFNIAQNVAFGRLTSAAAGQQVIDLITRLTR